MILQIPAIANRKSAKEKMVSAKAELFADEVQRDPACVRMRPVFPEIDPLPGSEREPAALERKGKIHRRQRGADVRGHIVSALGGVDEQRVAIAHEPREKSVEVAAHIGVGIFLDEQRGGSMPQMQRQQAVPQFILNDPLLDGVGEFNQTAPARRDHQFMKLLAHWRIY